jgi:hypothetical protein
MNTLGGEWDFSIFLSSIMSHHRLPFRGVVGFLFALASVSVVSMPASLAETWTSLRGTHSVDAKMVGLWSGNVILELGNGRRVSIKLSDLRSESRIQAEELSRKLDSARAERINSLKGQAVTAAAPAPDPLPVPPAAPDYVPPQPNQSAANFLFQLDTAIASGHLLAIYDSLPPAYRQDINELVKTSAQRLDAETWNGLVGSLQRVGDLIVTRQKWFVSSPRVQTLPPEQVAMAEGPLLTLAGVLRVGLDPQATQLDRLQSMDFREWLAARDQAMAPYLAQLFQQLGEESTRSITVDSESDGVATATIDVDGAKRQVTYVMIDGYWVPKSMADQWPATVQGWKESAESPLATSVTAASLFLQPITPMLEELAAAKDAGSFHASMENVFMPAEAIVTSIASLLNRSMNAARQPGGPDGYGPTDGESDTMMQDNYEVEMMESQSLDE